MLMGSQTTHAWHPDISQLGGALALTVHGAHTVAVLLFYNYSYNSELFPGAPGAALTWPGTVGGNLTKVRSFQVGSTNRCSLPETHAGAGLKHETFSVEIF